MDYKKQLNTLVILCRHLFIFYVKISVNMNFKVNQNPGIDRPPERKLPAERKLPGEKLALDIDGVDINDTKAIQEIKNLIKGSSLFEDRGVECERVLTLIDQTMLECLEISQEEKERRQVLFDEIEGLIRQLPDEYEIQVKVKQAVEIFGSHNGFNI